MWIIQAAYEQGMAKEFYFLVMQEYLNLLLFTLLTMVK